MSKYVVPVIAAAVVAVGILMLLELNRSPEPGTPADTPAVDTPVEEASPTTAGPGAKRVDPQPVDTDTPPDELPPRAMDQLAMERKLAADVPQAIYTAAADCYDGEPGKHEGMEVTYKLTFRNGVGRISDVRKGASDLNNPRLEDCIVEKLADYTWEDPQAPDLEEELSTSLSILGLRKRNTPFGMNPNDVFDSGAGSSDEEGDE